MIEKLEKASLKNIFNCIFMHKCLDFYKKSLPYHWYLLDTFLCWTRNWSGRPWCLSCLTPLPVSWQLMIARLPSFASNVNDEDKKDSNGKCMSNLRENSEIRFFLLLDRWVFAGRKRLVWRTSEVVCEKIYPLYICRNICSCVERLLPSLVIHNERYIVSPLYDWPSR